MIAQGFDVKKMPLEQLSTKTVMDGYNQLKEIETLLMKVKSGKAKLDDVMSDLSKFSSKFYTYIPHDFGMSQSNKMSA